MARGPGARRTVANVLAVACLLSIVRAATLSLPTTFHSEGADPRASCLVRPLQAKPRKFELTAAPLSSDVLLLAA